MSLPNLPGGVSVLWALIYMAVGFYFIPLLLGLLHGKAKAKATAAAV